MRFSRSLLFAALLGCTAMPAQAQMRPLSDPVVAHPDPEALFNSPDPKLHRNKQAALHIMRELLQCNQWSRAGEWLTDRYIQHNPLAASGLKGVQDYFINVAKRQPTPTCNRLTSPIVAVQAEGDYVTVLAKQELPVPGIPGETYTTTWFDTWRFVDGKADEHWDPATLPPVQATPAPAPASGGGMATGHMAQHQVALQQEADRAAIERLMWDYVRAIDGWNPDAYAAVFTPDGAFGRTKGREALRTMVADLKASQDQRRAEGQTIGNMHHVMSNQSIEFIDPTHARVQYYWMTVFGGAAGSPTPPNVAAVGRGVDDVVKVGDKWLIANRNVAPTS